MLKLRVDPFMAREKERNKTRYIMLTSLSLKIKQ